MVTYKVVKVFVTGVLAGLEITEKTAIPMEVGKTYRACYGKSSYTVKSCEGHDEKL